MDSDNGEALYKALADDDRMKVDQNIQSTYDSLNRRKLPLLAEPAISSSSSSPLYDSATTFNDLIQRLTTHAEPKPPPVVPSQDVAHEHSTRLSVPTEEDWNTHRMCINAISKHIASLYSQHSERLQKLSPTPAALSSAYVADMLCEEHGMIPSCAAHHLCQGRELPGGFILMRYVSPEKWQSYRLTGQLPTTEPGLCYLCLLASTCTATHKNIMDALRASCIIPPFCHYIGPGGYSREAMHSSSATFTYLVRRFNLSDYVVTQRDVLEPTAVDPHTGQVTKWTPKTIRTLSESAHLLYNIGAVPVMGRAVGACPMPECEDLLAAQFLPTPAPPAPPLLTKSDSSVIAALNHYAETARDTSTVVDLVVPFGCDMPTEIALCDSMPVLKAALTCCSLPVGRVRLFHALHLNGDTGLRNAKCLASQFVHWKPPPELRGCPETVPWILSHSVLVLLMLKMDFLTEVPVKSQKVIAYLDALTPLVNFYITLARDGRPLSDSVLFMPDATHLVPFAMLYPRPQPIYFSVQDLTTVKPVCNKAVDCTDYSFSCFTNAPSSPSYSRAWQSRAELCHPNLIVAFQWMADQNDAIDNLAWTPRRPEIIAYAARFASPQHIIWRTLLLRIELLYHMLKTGVVWNKAGRAVCEEHISAIGPSMEAAIISATATFADIDIVRDLTPVLKKCGSSMPPRFQDLSAVRAVKRLLRAHVIMCSELLEKNACTDAECWPLVYPQCYMDVENSCIPNVSHRLDEAEASDSSVVLWMLADAFPSAPVRTGDLIERCKTARASDKSVCDFMNTLTCASLSGWYDHATVVPPFERLLQIHQFCETNSSPLPGALESLIVREYAVDMLRYAFIFRAQLDIQFTNVNGWIVSVWECADEVRRSGSPIEAGVANLWPPDSGRVNARVGRVNFQSTMSRLCHSIDSDIAADMTIVHRAPVTPEKLQPPRDVLDVIEQFVAVLPLHKPFDCEWIAQLGVSRRSVDQIQSMQAELLCGALLETAATATQLLRNVALVSPLDYAIVSVFFRLLALQTKRRVIRLDASTAQRQLAAVLRNDGTYRPHLHDALVSSILCCNRIRNYTVQVDPRYTGPRSTRLNLDTGAMTCVTKRPKPQTEENLNRRGTLRSVNYALAEYYSEASQRENNTDARRRRLDSLLKTLQDKAEAHGSVMQKTVLTQPCGRPLLHVRIVGAVMEIQCRGQKTSSCTICPRCGSKTEFTPAMIGPCGFTCALCDEEERAAVERTTVLKDRCCLCNCTEIESRRAARKFQIYPRFTHYDGVDDCTVPGLAIVSRLWLCSVCFQSWMQGALRSYLTLSEVRMLYKHTSRATRLDELTFPTYDDDMLRMLRRPIGPDDVLPSYPHTALYPQSSVIGAKPSIPVSQVTLTNAALDGKITRIRRKNKEKKEREMKKYRK